VSTVLLDTHVVQWWSAEPSRAEPDRISAVAAEVLEGASELAVAAISWFELAWLARNERISVTIPIRSWLQELAGELRTVGVTPAIADTAVSLPSSFPGDPADRMIYATAIEHGWKLVTKDRGLREHPYPRAVAVW